MGILCIIGVVIFFVGCFSNDSESWMVVVTGVIIMVIAVAGMSKNKSKTNNNVSQHSSSVNNETEVKEQERPAPDVSKKKVCPQCGASLTDDSLYCEYCGNRIE